MHFDTFVRFFNYIINNKEEFPAEFSKVDFNDIYDLLKKYEMLYTKDSLQYITGDNLERIKIIDYAIALIVKDKLQYLTPKVSRDKLLKIYNDFHLEDIKSISFRKQILYENNKELELNNEKEEPDTVDDMFD